MVAAAFHRNELCRGRVGLPERVLTLKRTSQHELNESNHPAGCAARKRNSTSDTGSTRHGEKPVDADRGLRTGLGKTG